MYRETVWRRRVNARQSRRVWEMQPVTKNRAVLGENRVRCKGRQVEGGLRLGSRGGGKPLQGDGDLSKKKRRDDKR